MKTKIVLCIIFMISTGCVYKVNISMPTKSAEVIISNTQKLNSTITTSNIQETITSVEAQTISLTFNETIALSDCAARAELMSYTEYDTYMEFDFKVKNVIYGNIPEEMIHVFYMKDGSSGVVEENSYQLEGNIYTKGNEYILIMERQESLFYDYPHYLIVSDIYIPVKDIDKSTASGEALSKFINTTNIGEIEKTLKNLSEIENSEIENMKGKPQKYSKSDKIEDIVSESDLILELKIESLMAEGTIANSNTYVCDVLNVLKGDKVSKNEEGKIFGTLLKDSVKVGESYIILLNKIDDTSIIYLQSSKNSIIPINEKESVNKIMQILGK